MSDKYNQLNDVKINLNEYEPYTLSEKERAKMKENLQKQINRKKRTSWKKYAALAACIGVVAVLSQTAFAQNVLSGIIQSFSTGHNHFVQTAGEIPKSDLKLYDKDGNELDKMPENGEAYTEDGGMIKVSLADGQTKNNDQELLIYDSTQIAQYLSFAPKLPSYLPDGFQFDYAKLFKGEDGSVSGDYLFVYYKNAETGKNFVIHERIINEDTAFEAGTDEDLQQITVNGHTGVMTAESSLDWEADGISCSIMGGNSDVMTKDILLNIAATMQ